MLSLFRLAPKRATAFLLIFAGLGGYTGTKLTALVVEKLVAANRPFKCIVTYPFRFEGKSRAQNAEIFLDVFGNHPNVEVVHLDDFCRNRNMLLRQVFTFATLKMAMIANDLPGLNGFKGLRSSPLNRCETT